VAWRGGEIKLKGFIEFIRGQGVVGLAVGFILGGAVSKVVSSLVSDIITPILGLILGAAGNLKEASITIAGARVNWGNFINTTVDFLVIALVVYFGVRLLRLDKLDVKKVKVKR
jgi:large conductance mechanosensitive channel